MSPSTLPISAFTNPISTTLGNNSPPQRLPISEEEEFSFEWCHVVNNGNCGYCGY